MLHLALSDQASPRDSVAFASRISFVKQHATPPRPASDGKNPPVINVNAIRRSFPAQWSEYLKNTYRTAYAVQKAFPGIDSKTARDWIAGKRDPSGCFVAAVIAKDPQAINTLGRL